MRVAALIEHEGGVVLVRHAAGASRYHLLPGGGVAYGETMSEALEREVLEETGLRVEVGPPVILSDTISPDGARHIVNITFRCTVIGGAVGQPQDPRVEAVDIVELEQLPALDLRPPMADAVIEAVRSAPDGGARYLGALYTPEPPVPDVT